jgi:hypothetical protein
VGEGPSAPLRRLVGRARIGLAAISHQNHQRASYGDARTSADFGVLSKLTTFSISSLKVVSKSDQAHQRADGIGFASGVVARRQQVSTQPVSFRSSSPAGPKRPLSQPPALRRLR